MFAQVVLSILVWVSTVHAATRFAIVGDYGNGSTEEKQVAEMIAGWKVDFVATTGDNNYPKGEAATIDAHIGKFYHRFIGNYHGHFGLGSKHVNRFFPALGNHDWDNPLGAQPYLDYFTLPGNERYYDVVEGPVHLFIIDSDPREPDGVTADSIQALWLQDRLKASNSPWKIVLFHHPAYSSGEHHGSNLAMRWPFEAWGADIVFAGHEHLYERLRVGKITYVTCGLGGTPVHRFSSPLPQSIARYNARHGAVLATGDVHKLHFEFKNTADEIIDSFDLAK
jgi:tartrate-resistant acid phosphatase type 5